MENTEMQKYKIADGYYIRKYTVKTDTNETDFSFYYTSHKNLRRYSLSCILGCEKSSEHVILKEPEIRKAIEAIHSNFAYDDFLGDFFRDKYDLDDVVEDIARVINRQKSTDEPKVKFLKLEKTDGTATYFTEDACWSDLKRVKFLKEDLPLNNQENLDKIKTYSNLSWPVINATSKQLAAKMKAYGYELEYSGRSGFESRNRYIIKTKDGILTPELYQKMKEDLEQAKNSVKEEKKQTFDRYFDEQSSDKAKVYSLVETGYNYDLTRIMDEKKYESIAQIRIACTSDHRQGYDHTYLELVINKERIKEDKRKFIVLEVPKDMIGLIIGKGGCHIKEMQQKFGKNFKIVQDPREIAAEKKHQEEERKRERQSNLRTLQSNIQNFMGDNFITSDDESISISMVEYITNNQDKLPVRPTKEEMQQLKENLIAKRDEEIARENRRKAEEIAYQKRLEEERIAEQKRLEQEKIAEINQTIKDYIQTWADEHNGKVLSNEELVKFIQETYQDDSFAQKFTGKIQKDFFLKMEEERAMQKRSADAEKRFEKVVSEEFQKFFESNYDSEGHGYDYFHIVGKARRASGYKIIAERVEHRLGIYDDLRKPLEERLLDPRPQEDRMGSYLDEETKFRDRIIEFNNNVGDFEEYVQQQAENNEPKPTLEPTIENLAILWGAKKRKLK